MQEDDDLYGTIKNGVLVLSGANGTINLKNGSLCIRDGETTRLFGRAYCPVSRVVSTQWGGSISFTAIRWLHGIGAAFVHLGHDGTPVVTSCGCKTVPSKLRRRQALLTIEAGLGLEILRIIMFHKVSGQAKVLDHFGRPVGQPVSSIADLPAQAVLGLEAAFAADYWRAFSDWPVNFGKRQAVPDYWRTFGKRQSPLSGNPRAAVTPANAMLNYLYSVLASELTIALHAYGLDPHLGIAHNDEDNRNSLTYDLIEPLRPIVDRWFFDWLTTATFSKRDFIEGVQGGIRITRPLSSHLAMTASLWRDVAEQVVRWFFTCLERQRVVAFPALPASVATNARKSAKQWGVGNTLQPPMPATCCECGKVLTARRRKFCSDECLVRYYGENPQGRKYLKGLGRYNRDRAAAG